MMAGNGDGGRQRRQFALDLVHAPATGRDDFVRGAANARALDLVLAWPAWPARVLVLSGPPGSGKSHLAGIWADRAKAVMVDAADLDLDRLLTVASAAYVVEDVEREALDEVALFHLINHVSEAGGAIVLTARRPPSEWSIRLPDLASRLRAATLAEIGSPEDALLEAVLVKLFADRQIDVGDHVVRHAVRRMERSLAAAGELVRRIDRLSLEEKRRVTAALVDRALDDPPGEGAG